MAIKTYKSQLMAVAHQMIEGAYENGVIDKRTMREFDNDCLAPIPVPRAEEIKALREGEMLSQRAFALYLGVSKNLVSEWERGVKRPGGQVGRTMQ
jgi:putative transcriptional regulator